MEAPNIILLISGKRKSGKDFVSEKLKTFLGDACTIIRISEPIKSYYAKQNNLDLNELMSDTPYKEQHRLAMIDWSDEVRAKIPGYFCEAACSKAKITPIWLVSDVRRKTDVDWFKSVYQNRIKTIRINATENARSHRGWVFTNGVDNHSSECGLDDFTAWDLQIDNNNAGDYEHILNSIGMIIKAHL